MDPTPGDVALPKTLDEARIATLPSAAYYIPNFISEAEERHILDKVQTRLPRLPSLMENT